MKTKNNNIKISQSKIGLFIDCPRCFWLEVKYNIKRPEKITGGYIGQKYDPLIKNEFDKHRRNSTKPKELHMFELDIFKDFEKIKTWRKEVKFYHQDHNIIYYGKIDDLLINKHNHLVPFDFKTTLSKNFQIYESYKRQLEIYGYLLLKNKEKVADYGAFYVVKVDVIKESENAGKNETLIIEERDVILVEDLDYEKYDEILENLKEVYYSSQEPQPNPNCLFCKRDLDILKLRGDGK